MRMYVEMDSMAEEGLKIKKIAQQEITPLINELVEMVKKLEWEGDAHDSFVYQYLDKILYLYDISTAIDKIGEFYINASSSWSEVEDRANKGWAAYDDEIESLKTKLKVMRDTLRRTGV